MGIDVKSYNINNIAATLKNPEGKRLYSLISAICFALYFVYLIASINKDAEFTWQRIVLWIIAFGFSLLLFIGRKNIGLLIICGLAILMHLSYFLRYFSITNINMYSLVAYIILFIYLVSEIVPTVKSSTSKYAKIKNYLPFLPGAIFFLGYLIFWIKFSFSITLFGLFIPIILTVGFESMGLWLKSTEFAHAMIAEVSSDSSSTAESADSTSVIHKNSQETTMTPTTITAAKEKLTPSNTQPQTLVMHNNLLPNLANSVERLQIITELLDMNIITQEEYDNKKLEILGSSAINDNHISDDTYVSRYTRLYVDRNKVHCFGSPVVLLEHTLMKDNQLDRCVAKIKLKNISPIAVRTVALTILCLDGFDEEIGSVKHQIANLNAKRDEEFGNPETIPLPNSNTKHIKIFIERVLLQDGTNWQSEEANWYMLPTQNKLEQHLSSDALLEYKELLGQKSSYFPLEIEHSVWLCNCGAMNQSFELDCHLCRNHKEAVFDYLEDTPRHSEYIYQKGLVLIKSDQPDKIREGLNLFKEIISWKDASTWLDRSDELIDTAYKNKIYQNAMGEASKDNIIALNNAIEIMEEITEWQDAERKINEFRLRIKQLKSEEKERKVQEKKRKAEQKIKMKQYAKLASVICVFLVIIIAGFFTVTKYIQPNNRYKEALSLMEAEQYNEALSIFNDLGSFKDSSELSYECENAIRNNNYLSKYNQAVTAMDKGEYKKAKELFEDVQSHTNIKKKECADNIQKCYELIHQDTYDNAMKKLKAEDYVEAYRIFKSLGEFKDSEARASTAEICKEIQYFAQEQDFSYFNQHWDEFTLLGTASIKQQYPGEWIQYSVKSTQVSKKSLTVDKDGTEKLGKDKKKWSAKGDRLIINKTKYQIVEVASGVWLGFKKVNGKSSLGAMWIKKDLLQ